MRILFFRLTIGWLLLGTSLASAMPIAPLGSGAAGVSSELSGLISRCAPTVHPETMAALISAESKGHQFALADAGPLNMPWAKRKYLVRSYYFSSVDEATEMAEALIARGHTVSLGLTQVNDRNLAGLGISIREVFEPCVNLSAGGKIITEFYGKAVRQFGAGPRALRAAISAYNSGDWARGERDGYVNLVFKQRGKPLELRSDGVVRSNAHRVNYDATRGLRADKELRAFSMSSKDFEGDSVVLENN